MIHKRPLVLICKGHQILSKATAKQRKTLR